MTDENNVDFKKSHAHSHVKNNSNICNKTLNLIDNNVHCFEMEGGTRQRKDIECRMEKESLSSDVSLEIVETPESEDGDEFHNFSSLGITHSFSSKFNPFLINPFFAMGLQLPQLALLMQQQNVLQEQQQQNTGLGNGLFSSVVNPLLIPNFLGTVTSLANEKFWSVNFPKHQRIACKNDGIQNDIFVDTVNLSNSSHHTSYESTKDNDKATLDNEKLIISPAAKFPFICILCKDWFFSREKLVMHLIMNHKMPHCRICSKLLLSSELLSEHQEKVHLHLNCTLCDGAFTCQKELGKHYEDNHNACVCIFCGELMQPQSDYGMHLRKYHFVTSEYSLHNKEIHILNNLKGDKNSILIFHCRLCGKERRESEIFEHFFSHHRFSLLSLINLLSLNGIDIPIKGTRLSPISSENLKCNELMQNFPQHSEIAVHTETINNQTICLVCDTSFTDKMPKPFHDIICLGLVLCKFCNLTFPNKLVRNEHTYLEHEYLFSCEAGCACNDFRNEEELASHYMVEHCARECHYCQTLVFENEVNFSDHLKVKHLCTDDSIHVQGNEADHECPLFQCVRKEEILIVICSLCNSDITCIIKNIGAFFEHLTFHNISIKAAVSLLENSSLVDFHNAGKTVSVVRDCEKSASNTGILEDTSNEMEELLLSHSRKYRTVSKKEMNKKKSQNSNFKITFNKFNLSQLKPDKRDYLLDSLSDISSGDDFLCDSEAAENEGTGDDEDSKTDEWTQERLVAQLISEAAKAEAEVDPSEVQCIISETSDDELYDVGSSMASHYNSNFIADHFLPEVEIKEEKSEAAIETLNFNHKLKRASRSCNANKSAIKKSKFGVLENENEMLEEDMLDKTISSEDVSDSIEVRSEEDDWMDSDIDSEMRRESIQISTGKTTINFEDIDTVLTPEDNENAVCGVCLEKFTAEESLLEHLTVFHGFSVLKPRKEYKCIDGCGKTFKFLVSLKKHKAEFHKTDNVSTALGCPFCAVLSDSKTALRHHIFTCHESVFINAVPNESLAYNCRSCNKKFWRVYERNEHQIEAHSDTIENFFKCYVCSLPFTSKVCLNRHMKSFHTGEKSYSFISYKCKNCHYIFPNIHNMKKHFQELHPSSLVFRCRYCSVILKTRKTLKTHVKNLHSESRRRDCSLCGKTLWSKRAHAIHYRMKHSVITRVGFRCRICQKRFDSKEERKTHYQIDHEGESPYHCTECGKGFASKSGMYGHRQLHTGSGVSKCQYCGKEFTRKDSYNEHLLIHNGPRHKCPHCPKEFVQRSNLVRHIRIHTGEKPYKCTFCEKCFSDKGACNSHIRVHTREETCSCPYCGQTFSKKQKLKYHIRKHTGEGLINCEICGKSFTNSFALKEHRVIHNRQTQILCRRCGKGFNSEKYLQRHVAIVHEPAHTYTCPLCPKSFSQHARLKAHLMTHTGVKHIKCLLCEKAYSVRKSLRRHLLEKHQVSPDHPQYKHCFYAMTAEEAGLKIPVDVQPDIMSRIITDVNLYESASKQNSKSKPKPKPKPKAKPKPKPKTKKSSRRLKKRGRKKSLESSTDLIESRIKVPKRNKCTSKSVKSYTIPNTGTSFDLHLGENNNVQNEILTEMGLCRENMLCDDDDDDDDELFVSNLNLANDNNFIDRFIGNESTDVDQSDAVRPLTKRRRSVNGSTILGTTKKKKRRVEAIVQTLQKSNSTSNISGLKDEELQNLDSDFENFCYGSEADFFQKDMIDDVNPCSLGVDGSELDILNMGRAPSKKPSIIDVLRAKLESESDEDGSVLAHISTVKEEDNLNSNMSEENISDFFSRSGLNDESCIVGNIDEDDGNKNTEEDEEEDTEDDYDNSS